MTGLMNTFKRVHKAPHKPFAVAFSFKSHAQKNNDSFLSELID